MELDTNNLANKQGVTEKGQKRRKFFLPMVTHTKLVSSIFMGMYSLFSVKPFSGLSGSTAVITGSSPALKE